MEVKILEIRDRATFIPIMAVSLKIDVSEYEEAYNEMYLLRRLGFSGDSLAEGLYVVLIDIRTGNAYIDPPMWCDRTKQTAHKYIAEHFDDLPGGAVIDVEYILGETQAPKQSERFNDIVKEIENKGS